MVDALRFTPKGFLTWMIERDKSPGMVRVRENKAYAREVAAKLIEDKKQEPKNGTSRKDLLSLLGLFLTAPSSAKLIARHNARSFSQGEFCSATGLATTR
jgi:hypothetical protein